MIRSRFAAKVIVKRLSRERIFVLDLKLDQSSKDFRIQYRLLTIGFLVIRRVGLAVTKVSIDGLYAICVVFPDILAKLGGTNDQFTHPINLIVKHALVEGRISKTTGQ